MIEYILKHTDTNPENILCLTFTESGASNMRERLKTTIKDAAAKVNGHTGRNCMNLPKESLSGRREKGGRGCALPRSFVAVTARAQAFAVLIRSLGFQ